MLDDALLLTTIHRMSDAGNYLHTHTCTHQHILSYIPFQIHPHIHNPRQIFSQNTTSDLHGLHVISTLQNDPFVPPLRYSLVAAFEYEKSCHGVSMCIGAVEYFSW